MATTQLGTFSEYIVAAENSLIKIDKSTPFHAASLVSCGVTTGWGSATVCAGTEPGDTVVVIGIGGVGMNAVQGARAVGAQYSSASIRSRSNVTRLRNSALLIPARLRQRRSNLSENSRMA